MANIDPRIQEFQKKRLLEQLLTQGIDTESLKNIQKQQKFQTALFKKLEAKGFSSTDIGDLLFGKPKITEEEKKKARIAEVLAAAQRVKNNERLVKRTPAHLTPEFKKQSAQLQQVLAEAKIRAQQAGKVRIEPTKSEVAKALEIQKALEQAKTKAEIEGVLAARESELADITKTALQQEQENISEPSQRNILLQLLRGFSTETPTQAGAKFSDQVLKQLGVIPKGIKQIDVTGKDLAQQAQESLEQGFSKEAVQQQSEDDLRERAIELLQQEGLKRKNDPNAFLTEEFLAATLRRLKQ